MKHFHVEEQSAVTLLANYPHDPSNTEQSVADYLEDMLSQGYELAAFLGQSGVQGRYVFRVVAK